MIAKEKIEEVIDRANIVHVISEYVPLKKRGSNHVGLCPFHSEKTPSFSVNEDKKIFYCFGCNAGGSVINFLMKKEGMAFPDAVKSLATRYGVKIEETRPRPSGENDMVYQANRLAAEYFQRELGTAGGAGAREYLRERGFGGITGLDIIARFGVGFAPSSWDGLLNHLAKKGVSPAIAEKAGLLIKKDNRPGYYDRFRARLMFPISDLKGRVIAFGGRAMDDKEPKYLNSPESPVFKKGAVLYGLSSAKESIKKEGYVIVVEGYFDLMALHRSGFTNSVATMGTALTAGHIRSLKGYAGSVYALFDSDNAGTGVVMRALDLFISEDMPGRVVALPSGFKDPDELLKNAGEDAMKAAIAKSLPLMEFFFKETAKKTPLTTPENKARFLNAVVPYLGRIKNVAEKGHWAGVAASMLGISVDAVYEALGRPSRPEAIGSGPPLMRLRSTGLIETTILRIIIRHPDLFNDDVEEAVSRFVDPDIKGAGAIIAGFYRDRKGEPPSRLLSEITDERQRSFFASVLFKDEDGFIEAPEKMLKDSLKKVLNRGKLKAETEDMIRSLEDSGFKEAASSMRQRVMIKKGALKKD